MRGGEKMENKYINNNPINGIEYDFKRIRKEFKKLKIPKGVYNPCVIPFELGVKYIPLISERAIGKTTNLLLLGMCMYKLYSTKIIYIRQRETMITPKIAESLFNVIISNNYIELMTDGEYNTVVYKRRKWYYALKTEDDELIVSDDYFCYITSLDNAEQLKSGFNEPMGDFILFDEFIGSYYQPNEFIKFADLIKTIIRRRLSPLIFMSANTIDLYSPYFSELEIEEQVQKMKIGESDVIETAKGTKIYVEIIGGQLYSSPEKMNFNKLFFGFKSKKLSSITGDDWALDNYPHIPDSDLIQRGIYIKFHNKYFAVDIRYNSDIGYFCAVHRATKTHDDSLIFSDAQTEKHNEIYTMKNNKYGKRIIDFYLDRKFYYSDNTVGNAVTNFFKIKGYFLK